MHSEAVSINNAGQITGYGETTTRDHAFRYSGGTMTDIGTSLPPNLPNSYGLSINDAGHIVGIAYDVFFTSTHAFFYNGSTGSDIGNLGVIGASALAINNNDQIAGYSNITNFYVHAFRYSGGMMHDLGTLGGHYSYAISMNNSNVIVGGSFVDTNDVIYHAFVAVSNSVADLNSELDGSGNGWTLVEARGINDSGQIIGVGEFGGANHAFVLNPVPEFTDVKVIGPDVLLSFTTINAANYAVLSREDLASGTWSELITNIIGTGGIVTVTNAPASGPRRFYRVSLRVP
jgi:probable HAF family extracellular repeat protein